MSVRVRPEPDVDKMRASVLRVFCFACSNYEVCGLSQSPAGEGTLSSKRVLRNSYEERNRHEQSTAGKLFIQKALRHSEDVGIRPTPSAVGKYRRTPGSFY